MTAVPLLLLSVLAAPGHPAAVTGVVELELRGPLDSVRLAVDGGGETAIEVRLGAGEVRRTSAPVQSLVGVVETTRVEVAVSGEGSARVLRWVDAPAAEEASALRRRTLPPPRPPRARPGAAALLLLLAVLAVQLALQRRLAFALLAGATGSGALWALPLVGGTGAVRVLEADLDAGRWLRVDAARDALRVEPAPAIDLEVVPHDRRVRWRVRVIPLGPAIWRAESAGATLVLRSAHDPGARALEPGLNRWGRLERTWLRETSGTWSERGAWDLGRALPPARAGSPPGWLAASLPRGRRVLVGLLGRAGEAGAPGPGPGRDTWIRLLGFPEPPANPREEGKARVED